jgi:hypothetical protein
VLAFFQKLPPCLVGISMSACPDSDQVLHRSEMSRCAKRGSRLRFTRSHHQLERAAWTAR